MSPVEIMAWAVTHGAPFPDGQGRRVFRCSATLRDGSHLPCVVLRDAESRVANVLGLLERRDAEDFQIGYPSLVRGLALGGSRVESTHLSKLEPCRYAIPWSLLQTLPLEQDYYGPLSFTATMDDGARFAFHGAFELLFFNMPEGYDGSRVRSVTEGFEPGVAVYRDRICFVSYVERGR